MPSPWRPFTRPALAVLALFALPDLIVRFALDVARIGWSGGVLPTSFAILAGWVEGLSWYLPVAALAGGVAVGISDRARIQPQSFQVMGASTGLALVTFALRGFLGPHLGHRARFALIDAESRAALEGYRANDWSLLLRLTSEEGLDGSVRSLLLADVHATVAFALLAALLLPLGLAIGSGSRRFGEETRFRAAWGMAGGTIIATYGAQIGAWWLLPATELSPGAPIYLGFLSIPLVILLTLLWVGGAGGDGHGEGDGTEPSRSGGTALAA